ncbi:alpha/beta fold hydrolase [Coriobacterium glomerans]|nr:alpha/beta hydrolase [Coriobacterium glomerans]
MEELKFQSANGSHQICAWIYTPLGEPRGIIQLIHGMGEHSRRYMHMIGSFLEAGFVVAADDHLAHGKTGIENAGLGNPGTHGSDGYLAYLRDERTLHDEALRRVPDVPYFLFGHSWGSMIAREYAARYGEDLLGVMLCGVVSQFAGFERMVEIEPRIAADADADGERSAEEYFKIAFSDANDRFGADEGPNAWIASDPEVVADHGADPFNSFDLTVQFAYDAVQLYRSISDPAWAERVDTRIPFHLISGDQDPTTNFGEGLFHTVNALAESGHQVSSRVYPGYRHEIQNERSIRADVEGDLIGFVEGVLASE